MNLYLISQDVNNGYDTFNSAVVVAETEEEARHTHPSSLSYNLKLSWDEDEEGWTWCWTKPENVKVKLIGQALPHIPKGRICASFNAG